MKFAVCASIATSVFAGEYLNQEYKTDLVLDLWTPPNYPCGVDADAETPSSPTPLVVHIHGGGWFTGSKDDMCTSGGCGTIVPDVAKGTGAAVLALNYDLTGVHPKTHVISEGEHMPKQIRDVIDAVNWVLNDASTYNIDRSKVVCSGQSAGGHLCSLLATYSAEQHGSPHGAPPLAPLKAAMVVFPPTDVLNMQQDADADSCVKMNHDGPFAPESALVGAAPVGGIVEVLANVAKYQEIYDNAVNANPITFVSSNSPPMFIRVGSCDTLVPKVQSDKLRIALEAAGVDVDFKIVDGGTHFCQPSASWQSHIEEGTAWLTSQLTPQEASMVSAKGRREQHAMLRIHGR